jgi:hypothetical protein
VGPCKSGQRPYGSLRVGGCDLQATDAEGAIRVLGGSDFGNRSPQGKELRIELISPPYLSAGPRPTIASARANVGYGVSFTVETLQASQVASVAWVRCSSVTHAFNADQRYVRLRILGKTATAVTVATSPNSNIAPPGSICSSLSTGKTFYP